MRKFMTILFIGFLTVTLCAQDAKSEIEFKSDVIQYGEISKGSDGVRKFEFTNTGNAPLIISDTYGTCGCTVPTKPKGAIAPGSSGIIEVKYDTNRVGPFRKTITVVTNSSETPISLKIKGEVLDN